MASPSFAPEPLSQKRLSLAEIDALVSAKRIATRTLGNAQPACFNRRWLCIWQHESAVEHYFDRPFL